jgi:hypothetical protein
VDCLATYSMVGPSVRDEESRPAHLWSRLVLVRWRESGTKAGKRPSGSHTATAIREVHSTLHTSIATNVASDGGDLSFFFSF